MPLPHTRKLRPPRPAEGTVKTLGLCGGFYLWWISWGLLGSMDYAARPVFGLPLWFWLSSILSLPLLLLAVFLCDILTAPKSRKAEKPGAGE